MASSIKPGANPASAALAAAGGGMDFQAIAASLIEVERIPIQTLENKKTRIQEDKKNFGELQSLVSKLGTSLNGLRNRTDFYKLKCESSHPDIIEGTVDNQALIGSYDVEVTHLAKTHKLLAEAFPDKDETPVGFGYMTVENDEGDTFDVEIDPDACTLEDVAKQINNLNAGVKAVVLNTKENLEDQELDAYRLLVISEKTGKQSRVYVDPDSTYLEFKEQITGRNLEMKFEDVPVFDEDNSVDSLMPGLTINAKRAEPGTLVTLKIDYDVEATLEGIAGFVDSYNQANEFLEKYFQKPEGEQGQTDGLRNDSTLRNVQRALKSVSLYQATFAGDTPAKFRTLSQIGITTERNGNLKVDETVLKKALTDNYVDVANLFVQGESSAGVAGTLSNAVRNVQNPTSGAIGSKDRQFNLQMKNLDDDIARKERIAGQRAESLKRRFASLQSMVGGLNQQGQVLQARLGGGGG